MYLDEIGHVQWDGLTEYSDYKKSIEFVIKYNEGIHPACIDKLNNWIEAKRRYEEKITNGMDWKQAGRETAYEMQNENKSI